MSDPVQHPAQARAYPVPAPASDRRFSLDLTIDVARVLAEHGYPPITVGGDLVALQQALFGFLYAVMPHDADGFGWSRDTTPEAVQAPAGVDVRHLGRGAEQ